MIHLNLQPYLKSHQHSHYFYEKELILKLSIIHRNKEVQPETK